MSPEQWHVLGRLVKEAPLPSFTILVFGAFAIWAVVNWIYAQRLALLQKRNSALEADQQQQVAALQKQTRMHEAWRNLAVEQAKATTARLDELKAAATKLEAQVKANADREKIWRPCRR